MSNADQIPPPLLGKPAAQPLIGKTVMLTRAPAQSAEMAGRLEQLGAAVIYCPTIQMIEPTSWEDLDAAINRLNSYNWLIFTSANGVEFFFRRLAEKHSDGLSVLSSLRICV